MKDIDSIADRFEVILQHVVADPDALDPSPDRYFLFGDRDADSHWILGISFRSKTELRAALENGICYQIHTFVLDAVANDTTINNIKTYVVFDFDVADETDDDQQELRNKFIQQLESLQKESENKEFETCELCTHSLNDHLMLGHTSENDDSAPIAGWMICKNEDCVCFRTWSVG